MITSLRLGIDDSPSSRQAEAMAIGLARTTKASIEAIAVIDTPWIDRPQAVGIGGTSYHAAAEEHILRAARERAAQLAGAFATSATGAGVAHATRVVEGDPVSALADEPTLADMIVMGREASFWGEKGDEISPAAEHVLRRGTRPVLVAPSRAVGGDAILCAFDGSSAAERSLHMLALLGLGNGRKVGVISIGEDRQLAEQRAEAAAQLLRAHGVGDVTARGIASKSDPAEVITQESKTIGAGIVAMGAFGHAGLREILFGSCTRSLLHDASPFALFVHH